MRQAKSSRAVQRSSDSLVAYQLPLVEICERKRVLVENYIGILAYGSQEIRIRVSFGSILIRGNRMRIRKICKEKLVISGDIDAVVFQGRA